MNKGIVENLDILAKYYKIINDDFRRRAYEKAIISVQSYPREITTIADINNLSSVGKGIGPKIAEYINTGRMAKADEFNAIINEQKVLSEKDKVLNAFSGIVDVGPVTAQKLWDKGFRTVKEVANDPRMISNTSKVCIKYYEDLLKKIPRDTISAIDKIIRFILNESFGKSSYRMDIAGSYRRKEPSSGDIDVLITSIQFDLSDVVLLLKNWGIITDTISVGPEKFMGIGSCPSGDIDYYRIDILFLPEDYYEAGLLYFTGSMSNNVAMRVKAKKMGLKLNQRGLYDGSRRIPATTEKEIYQALGMQYIPPNKR